MEGHAFREKITNIFTKVQPLANESKTSLSGTQTSNSSASMLRTVSMKKVDSFSSLE